MSNSLLSPEDLVGFAGGPFDELLVDAAAGAIRDEIGWHLAPVQTHTLTVSHDGGRKLLLPTRRIVSVTQVRDVSTSTPRVITGWRVLAMGALEGDWWPTGEDVVEVDLVHGFPDTPSQVLAYAARLCQMAKRDVTVQQEAAQPFMVVRAKLDELQGAMERDATLDLLTARLP